MNIGELRVRIKIQKNETVADQYGNHTSAWTDYFSCWATVGSSTGSESSGAVINPEESLNFTVRYSSETAAVESTKYRVLTAGKIYNITYVNTMAYKHNSLVFNCKLEREKNESEGFNR